MAEPYTLYTLIYDALTLVGIVTVCVLLAVPFHALISPRKPTRTRTYDRPHAERKAR